MIAMLRRLYYEVLLTILTLLVSSLPVIFISSGVMIGIAFLAIVALLLVVQFIPARRDLLLLRCLVPYTLVQTLLISSPYVPLTLPLTWSPDMANDMLIANQIIDEGKIEPWFGIHYAQHYYTYMPLFHVQMSVLRIIAGIPVPISIRMLIPSLCNLLVLLVIFIIVRRSYFNKFYSFALALLACASWFADGFFSRPGFAKPFYFILTLYLYENLLRNINYNTLTNRIVNVLLGVALILSYPYYFVLYLIFSVIVFMIYRSKALKDYIITNIIIIAIYYLYYALIVFNKYVVSNIVLLGEAISNFVNILSGAYTKVELQMREPVGYFRYIPSYYRIFPLLYYISVASIMLILMYILVKHRKHSEIAVAAYSLTIMGLSTLLYLQRMCVVGGISFKIFRVAFSLVLPLITLVTLEYLRYCESKGFKALWRFGLVVIYLMYVLSLIVVSVPPQLAYEQGFHKDKPSYAEYLAETFVCRFISRTVSKIYEQYLGVLKIGGLTECIGITIIHDVLLGKELAKTYKVVYSSDDILIISTRLEL